MELTLGGKLGEERFCKDDLDTSKTTASLLGKKEKKPKLISWCRLRTKRQ
jgi:hypothetical protein